MNSARALAIPKSNRVLFNPPRIAKRWTDGKPYRKAANDNLALMDNIERPARELSSAKGGLDDRAAGGRTVGRELASLGAPVTFIDNGPSPGQQIVSNDNRDEASIEWPLGKVLRADVHQRLLRAATIYRYIAAIVGQPDVLRGTEPGGDLYRLD